MLLRVKGITTASALVGTLHVLSLGLGMVLLSACQPEEEPASCPDESPPPFFITVRANDGPLPSDTVLTLHYGGGVEIYDLAEPDTQQSVLRCDPEPAVHGVGGAGGAAGAGGAPASSATESLTCELWIEGAATLRVSGGEYPDLSQELQGETNECGAVTVEAELILGDVSTDSNGE